jgi:UDP-glucose 4-epimerase
VNANVPNIIFSSTAAVYAENDGAPITEDAPLHPTSPYGASKMMSERVIQDSCRAHGLNAVILRYFNVAGADMKGRSGQTADTATSLIRLACQTALDQRPALQIYGNDYATPDGTAVRDYIHVCDLAAAHISALEYLLAGGKSDIFNCGYGEGISVQQVVDAFADIIGHPLTARMAPRREGDLGMVIAGAYKIRQKLKWEPRYNDLQTIIRSALAWEMQLTERRKIPATAAVAV